MKATIHTLVGRMTEAQLQAAVLEMARWRNWLCYHPYSSLKSEPGFPDLVMLRGTRSLIVELKSARGKCSPAQVQWLEQFEAAGFDARVWRPEQWVDGTIEKELL